MSWAIALKRTGAGNIRRRVNRRGLACACDIPCRSIQRYCCDDGLETAVEHLVVLGACGCVLVCKGVNDMPDVEKVIHELELCLDDAVAAVVPRDTVVAAIELLKAQEPVEPTIGGAEWDSLMGSRWYKCGACEYPIDKGDRYCRHCGRPVKWE